MTFSPSTVEELLTKSRGGDAAALAQLLAQERHRLAAAAKQTAAESGKSLEEAMRAAELVERAARDQFSTFTGGTEREFTQWLDGLLRRVLKGNAVPASSLTGMANGDATLAHSPAPAAEAPPGDGTLAVPPNRAGTPPSDATLAPESDRTLVPSATGGPKPNIHEQNTMVASAKQMTSPSSAAKIFGDYELLSKIAQGGMGVVYKARQRKLNRVVALKMILAGQFADELDVGRFYAEAESAANLRHPNIVGIHEVGEINGQHFFSMDYIEGKSLADIVRENPLPPRDAAIYAKKVAEAMHYAHTRGILHRDLKPSNVLVDRSNEPLVTDFGLAKRVGGESQLTMSGTILGTPSYMPPEQASGKAESAGPESDVYSLGAILYELLTGAPPFRAATPYETIRQVLEREPLAPRQVNPSVPQDLETICVKCLQKETTRRYASAQEMADELGRYLEGKPILARPVSPVERVWRWCRRNPLISSLAAAAVIGVVLALAGTTAGYVQSMKALALSEQSRRDQQQAVDELFTSVSENTLLNAPGMQPLRQELLQKALKYYQRFLEQRGSDPAMADEVARTMFRIGKITEATQSPQEALPHYEEAAAAQRDILERASADPARLEALGDTLAALGRAQYKLHNLDETEKYFREAIETRERLVAAAPEVGEYKRQLASSHTSLGVFEQEERNNTDIAHREIQESHRILQEAVALGQASQKLKRELGRSLMELSHYLDDAAAEQKVRQASEVASELLKDDPKSLSFQGDFVVTHLALADRVAIRGEAELAAKQSSSRATFEESAKLYEDAKRVAEPLAQRNPEVAEYQISLASVLMNWGYLEQFNLMRHQRAGAAYRQAIEILDPLVKAYPAVPKYRRELAATERALGELARADKQWAEARARLNASRQHFEELVKEFPDSGEFVEERTKTLAALQLLAEEGGKE